MAYGLPADATAWAALALAVALVVAWLVTGRTTRTQPARVRATWWVVVLATCAAVLSAGYLVAYLRGGPRIIDATAYFLQARALAAGQLAFQVPEPVASFAGRFLVTPPTGGSLAVIFPPGYAALLATGFVVGAPLAVGPLLAAALVLATYDLARCVTGRTEVALLAAGLSVLCAALRYHTADTMSHGWAALLVTLSVRCALAVRGKSSRAQLRWGALLGLASGWLIATRPVAGAAITAVTGMMVCRERYGRWSALLGLLPGIGLLLAHQYAATGSLWQSTQLYYYARADGPPGCFAWGFGAGVGCLHEHGDFVQRHLPNGFGWREALSTTGLRLFHHARDLANFRPLALLLPVAIWLARRERGMTALGACILLVVLAYVPFYFDGSYPGGGARLLADVLPLEHVLLAWVLSRWRVGSWVVPVALAGFAFGASHDHARLRDREGGHPMFEPHTLKQQGVTRGLVYVSTDHGFNLGHNPSVHDPSTGVVVARRRGDAHDRLLWEQLGRPQAFRYDYDPYAPSSVGTLRAYAPGTIGSERFEAEALWPARNVTAGWVHPTHVGSGCASQGQGLRLRPFDGVAAEAQVDVVADRQATFELVSAWVAYGSAIVEVETVVAGRASKARRRVAVHECWTLPPLRVVLAAGPHPVLLRASDSAAVLDYLELRPVSRPKHHASPVR